MIQEESKMFKNVQKDKISVYKQGLYMGHKN